MLFRSGEEQKRSNRFPPLYSTLLRPTTWHPPHPRRAPLPGCGSAQTRVAAATPCDEDGIVAGQEEGEGALTQWLGRQGLRSLAPTRPEPPASATWTSVWVETK